MNLFRDFKLSLTIILTEESLRVLKELLFSKKLTRLRLRSDISFSSFYKVSFEEYFTSFEFDFACLYYIDYSQSLLGNKDE